MIEQGLFKRYFVGRDGFIWWIGQVAPESSWAENKPGRPVPNNDSIKGFGERYRVRIMGYHTADIDAIPDNELPWAYVMYPVTAGGGGRNGSCSANISQGDFIFGFFMDGEDAQMPVIMGILGNNEYAAVQKNISKARFIPFSGYTENDNISSTSLTTDQGGLIQKQEGGNAEGKTEQQVAGEPNNKITKESASCSISCAADEYQKEEESSPLAESSDCEPIPAGKIQKEIQNIIVKIQKLQKSLYKYSGAVNNRFSDIQTQIDKEIAKATKFIASGMKWIFTEIEKFVINTVNEELKKTYFLLFPNERPQLKKAVEDINDLIACLFRKFIGELMGQMGSFLKDAAKKVINAAECLAESLIGNTLGKIIKNVHDTITQALGAINSLVGQATNIAGDILGIITNVLSFLSCEEKPECSSVNEWNILSGPGKLSKGDLESIIGRSKNFAKGFETAVQNVGVGAENLINLDFSDVFNVSGCGLGPIACGPPLAQFFGVGSGAAGNLIIGAAGEVLGIDMKSFGMGYDKARTFGKVKDQCGKGNGAVIRPIIEIYTDADGNRQSGVVDIEVVYSGTGYLPAPDGSKGGNGYTWADPDDTIVKKENGDYETPRPPGNILVVNPGDQVTLPPGTFIVTEPQPGENIEGGIGTIRYLGSGDVSVGDVSASDIDTDQLRDSGTGTGGGEEIIGGNPVIISRPGVFTSPKPDYSRPTGIYPTENTGSYPVILYLCEIFIDDSGINYNFEDKVVIEPDIGAKVEAKFDDQGRVVSVKVTEQGEGFTEFPRLYIRSETGYNAQLRPKLCIDRVGSDELKEPQTQDKVISVIDCVGKV